MDHALRFVYRYGNLLHKYYPLLDGLVKSGIPDNRPIGQHSYKVEITDCTKVMVDLRGVIRAEHVNRQKSFFFTGTSDINCAFLSARRACLEMHDDPPPPPVRKNARCWQQNRDKSQSQASQEAKPELRRLLHLEDGRCDQAAGCPRPGHAPQNHESVPAPLVVDISYPDLASDDDSTASWDGNSDSIVPDSKQDAEDEATEGTPVDLFSDSDTSDSDKSSKSSESSMHEPEPEHGEKRRRCD